MCQPGRPGPHGDSHAGSPGFAAFQSAKSTGAALALVDLDARAGAFEQLLERAMRERAVARRSESTWKYTPWPSTTYACPAVDELGDELDHRLDALGRVRLLVGPQHVEAVELARVKSPS